MEISDYDARHERRMREPHTSAINWGNERLARWLMEAAEGSLEEAVLAAMAAWPERDEQWSTSLGYFIHCEQTWTRVRALAVREQCRRSTDLPLRLPFPLSQAIVSLADSATMVPIFAEVRFDARGARLAAEILETFPDEDPRVRIKLGAIRAELLLCAGDPAGHVLYEKLVRARPESWLPLAMYFEAAESLDVTDPLVWSRLAEMIEDGLATPKLDEDVGIASWDPEAAMEMARELAGGRRVESL